MNKEFLDKFMKEVVKDFDGTLTDKYKIEDLIQDVCLETDAIYEDNYSSHRWYDAVTYVIKVGDMFVEYDHYHITGDDHWTDMGLEFQIESVREVFPKEIKTIIYV